jgi:RNA polymerase sigma factor (sigma-70 family)
MDANPVSNAVMAEQDHSIAVAFENERVRLRNFIRKRVADPGDADDVLQDVFYELVEAARLMQPVEQVGAWLFRVARNRIIDLFRKQKTQRAAELPAVSGDDEEAGASLEDLLPSADQGPEAAFARRLLLEELDAAVDELPEDQRSVFIAHELEGVSFKELAAQTGVSVNTLLSRKHYAVVYLRRRLQAIHDEFTSP